VADAVRIVFLGGLGEIGRNCMALEVAGKIILLDCGLMFPDADMHGIDLVLPDFTYLRENADRVEAILLTHAHEDHAGGIAFLLRDISVPVYGSALSLALARNRIEEAGMLGRTELIPVVDGERRRIGPVDCQFIPVTHSVPEGFAIAFFTPVGTIILRYEWVSRASDCSAVGFRRRSQSPRKRACRTKRPLQTRGRAGFCLASAPQLPLVYWQSYCACC